MNAKFEKLMFVSPHAQERIRQRFNISALREMQQWATEKVKDANLISTGPDGRKIFRWGSVDLIVSNDENVLITVLDQAIPKSYADKFKDVVTKQVRKELLAKEREFRKAEINVAEITLNMLKARNPKIKTMLNDKLTKANDYKENLLVEIKSIRQAAQQYGVQI